MPQQGPPDDLEVDLLSKIKSTPMESLRRGVRQVEGLSREDEENHERWLKSRGKRLRVKLFSWFLHFLFFVFCGVVLAVVLATLYLTGLWIHSFKDNPGELAAFLGSLWDYGLIALATLFLHSLVPKD